MTHERLLTRALTEYHDAARRVEHETRAKAEAETNLRDLLESQQTLQRVAEGVQNLAIEKIAEVVTRCLRTVFGDRYEFRIAFERKRGRTEARLHLVTQSGLSVDPVRECGGGVLDVCSFGLRLAALALSRPQRRKLLVLDEPAKHLSPLYRPKFRDLVLTLSHELGVQVVMVTHSKALKIGKVIDVEEL